MGNQITRHKIFGVTIGRKKKNKEVKVQNVEQHQEEKPIYLPLEQNLSTELPTGTKITDLNSDCLEHILLYLDLKNLLNVADTNKYLKSVAEQAFVRKYKIDFSVLYITFSGNTSILVSFLFGRVTDSRVNLKTCFQIVRHFGHLVRSIYIDIDSTKKKGLVNSKFYDLILNNVNDYCINMWSIGIKGITILNKFQKPFSKVVCIFLEGCSLGPNSIDWLFPNMELLRYKAVNGNFIDIEKHMPKLMNLTIEVSHGKRSNSCSKSIETVCRLNPQLKYFEVHLGSGLNMQLLADLSKYLQSLASLKIYVNSKEDLYYEGDTIHFKSLNYFDINLKLKGDELFPKIPFSSDRLKSLEIRTIYRYSDELFKFISNHPTIDTLRFWSYMYIDEMNVKKIASVLPALKIIDFYDEYSFEEVCDCLTEFKLLKRFKFRLKDENKLDDLRVRFGNEWQISKTIANFIEMKRTNSNTSIFFPQIIFCCILYEP